MTTTTTAPRETPSHRPGATSSGESAADSKAFDLLSAAVYIAALLATGYALFDALVIESKRVGELTALGEFAPYVAALAGVLVIECFAIIVAHLSTAARLAGKRAPVLRLIPVIGVAYSGFLNVTAHWADSKVIAIFLPGVGALGLLVWLLRVEHKYRARFDEIKEARDAARSARRHDLTTRERIAYTWSKGMWKTYTGWKTRTVKIGDASRAAYEKRVLAALDFDAPAELADKAPAAIAKHAEPVRATATVDKTVVDRITAGALTEATEERPAIERRPAPAAEPSPALIADALDRVRKAPAADPAPKPTLRAVGGQPTVEEAVVILHREWKGTIPRAAYEAVTALTGIKGAGKIGKVMNAYREQYAA